ncbi:putative aminoadipate reductase [Mycena sanguinolenta]|nr:putative aminoadipate reductase [Mycena sanguinolenta]
MPAYFPSDEKPMLVPDVIAYNIEHHPNDPCFLFAPTDTSAPNVTVSQLEFGRATHRVAHYVRPNREGPNGEVVAVIALSDTMLYMAIVAGLMTANCIPFPISPRNSPTAVVNLLKKTGCHRMVSTCVTLDALLVGVKEELQQTDPDFALSILEAPPLSQIYPHLGTETAECAFESYPTSTYRPEWNAIGLYLHSSGSTGLPKAIPETNRILWQWANLTGHCDVRDRLGHPFGAMAIPPFHMSGTHLQLLHCTYGRIPIALFPPTALTPASVPMFPNPDNVLEHSRRTNCKVMGMIPVVISAWAQNPEHVKYLATLDCLLFSGGSLPQRLGNTLVASGVKLRELYGATEIGPISAVVPRPEDEHEWHWIRFADQVKLSWAPQGDETFEFRAVTSENHTVGVENIEGVKGYATSDLWVQHPEKKHLWKMVGRMDDVIVHTSGEKTVPAPIEGIVLSSPLVAGAVMFGWEREQSGILIETKPNLQIDITDSEKVIELRNKLWPVIQEANDIAPAFSRIFKEMIIFTPANKQLPRTGKGTVARKAALKMFAQEIDTLYDLVDQKASVDKSKMPSVWEPLAIQPWLLDLASDLTDNSALSPEEDLFHQGFDSLSATFLRLRILSAVRASDDPAVQKVAHDIPQNLIYAHPTIAQLAAYIARSVSGASADALDSKRVVESMIEKHTTQLTGVAPAPYAGSEQVVLLTGSTGSLGSQVLATLLKDERVKKVYALNRPSSSQDFVQRHMGKFSDRGLDVELLKSPKLHFIEGKTDGKNLGLNAGVYDEIRNSVTLIIHNAWKLDFNLSLGSFENHIVGTRNLVDLALSAPHAPKFVFTSSIASAVAWDRTKGPCPEEILSTANLNAESMGYGQSKFVAEQILVRSGLPFASLRIGQISGSANTGAWATSDWLPILVKSSLALRCIPLAEGLASWIDFDSVTGGIMDVAFAPTTAESKNVYNLVHPRPVSWNFVAKSLRETLAKKGFPELPLVPFSEWFNKLEAAAEKSDARTIPGISLIGFFHYLAMASTTTTSDTEFGEMDFATEKMQAASSTLRMVKPMSADHVEAWVNYWVAAGFISA